MIQEQNSKPSPLPWKVDDLRIYDADNNMVAEIKASHWMTFEQVMANAQYIADALRLKQEMTESEKNFQKFILTPDDVAEIMSEMRNTPCPQCNGTGLMKVFRGEPSQGYDEAPCDLCLEGEE